MKKFVVIDHYIKNPVQVSEDARFIANQSGGKVVLGELGAPIPDIHGDMTEEAQSEWIEEALEEARDRGPKWKKNIDASLRDMRRDVRQATLAPTPRRTRVKTKR